MINNHRRKFPLFRSHFGASPKPTLARGKKPVLVRACYGPAPWPPYSPYASVTTLRRSTALSSLSSGSAKAAMAAYLGIVTHQDQQATQELLGRR